MLEQKLRTAGEMAAEYSIANPNYHVWIESDSNMS